MSSARPIYLNRQLSDSNNVAAIFSPKIIKSNPPLNKFCHLPVSLTAIIIYELIKIKWDALCCLSVITPQHGPHLPQPEKGLDVVWLEGQNVSAGVQRLLVLLQFELSGGQVVQTLHTIVPHLLLLCLHIAITKICTKTEPHMAD